MKKILSFLLLTSMFACSTTTPVNQVVKTQTNSQKNNVNTFVANVSDKAGASFSANINFNSFSAKGSVGSGNVNGTQAKIPTDVKAVDVYLLKLPFEFTGTDPIGTANANVVSSFTDVAKSGSSINILFKNVPGLATTNQYWVGIVAKDAMSSGNVISKAPTTAWTGGTATVATSGMSLSTSGVGVDPTTLAVSTLTDLTVNIGLLDIVGAQISTDANITAGSSTLPTLTAQ